MAASKRGFRSILSKARRTTKKISKSSYTNLPDDSGTTTTTTPTVFETNPISVNVTVLTSADATPELECINGAETHPDKTIDDIDSINAQEKKEVEEEKEEEVAEEQEKVEEKVKVQEQVQETVQEQVQENAKEKVQEEKVSEDENVFEATRRAAILMVQNASSMTDMMATTLASKSITPETATPTASQEATTVPQEIVRVKTIAEEKIEVEMDDTDFERELHKKVKEACRWGKERVDNALTKTHEVASDLVENSLSLGESAMVSTEACSRSAFADGLALSPVLEHTSERLEFSYESAVAEVQEFLLEHWAKLKDYIVARYYDTTTTTTQKPKVAAPDDTVLHVAIEVRMKTRN